MQIISLFATTRRLVIFAGALPLALGLARGDAATNPTSTPPETAAHTTALGSAGKPTPPKSKLGAQAKPAPSATAPSSVVQLPAILVTAATRNAQPIDTTATSSTVITHDDLENSEYVNVAQALMSVPGVAVVPSGVPGQVTSVFIRGGDSDQTLLTLDGRHQPVSLTGETDFTNLTLDNIDQIEVVRTPSSSLQGGNSAGGVINLVTLTGRGLKQPESSASFEGGSFGTMREILQSRGAEGNFDYAVSGSNEDANMNRDNENYRNKVYRGNFGYQAPPQVYVDVHTGYSLAYAGLPNTIETPDPVGRLLTEDWFVSPEVTAKVTSFYTTKVYYNHDQQRLVDHDPFTNFLTFQFPASQRTQIDTNSFDWQNNFQISGNWQMTAGIQSDDTDVSEYDDLLGMQVAKDNLFNIAGYAESQWQPLPGLNVISSVRYDHYSDYTGALSWRQGVSYRIAPTQTLLHASGSSSYTPPSEADLYFPGSGNPKLKPETSLGWEAGIEQPFLNGRVTPGVT